MEETLDCTQTAEIEGAYDFLVANCLKCCSSKECEEAFAFVEAHHDFCLHDQVPKEVEVGFHDLEEVCAKQCDIGRLKDPDHSVCPDMTCPDEAGVVQVVNDLFALGCKDTCTNDNACGENFRKLRFIHDVCPALDDKAFEWAGIFPISGTSTTWLMQKVDGSYADPAMKVVFIPVAANEVTAAKLEELENVGSNLLSPVTGTCDVVNSGATITPVADGSCFDLTVDASSDDSTFIINTDGIVGLAVYAQHVPLEFERDLHYLYDTALAVGADTNDARDTAGANVEPVAQEGGGGGHSHGHRRLSKMQRRLLDVDAALHDFEDPCDAVGCYIEVEGCTDSPDLTSRADLQDRADKKCHHSWFTEVEVGREVGRSVKVLGSQPSRSSFSAVSKSNFASRLETE